MFSFRQAGPNAPLNWVKESVKVLSPDSNEQRKKVFLGLNFYGMDYSPSGGTRKFFFEIVDAVSFCFFVFLFVCLFVCLSVCPSVCSKPFKMPVN